MFASHGWTAHSVSIVRQSSTVTHSGEMGDGSESDDEEVEYDE